MKTATQDTLHAKAIVTSEKYERMVKIASNLPPMYHLTLADTIAEALERLRRAVAPTPAPAFVPVRNRAHR